MSTITTRQMRAWAIANGHPEQAGKAGRLSEHIVAAYQAAHPDETAPTSVDEEPLVIFPGLVDDDDDDDDPNYTVIVNAWDGDHATLIAQAAANLIGATHDSTKQRILTALREQGTCRCITDAITIIEEMA